ncbi:tyrosine-type recombinase/integrase [uncultured Desulfuromusa sp.]|uniref:tyrosine-type recombinase/integrase n=1 Tax=uncultured Desulfuromusa sp. TaxID=219183 RepID=UPI002AA8D9CF|nr:tyrosine-type recombinase/integrase [uncultured Desulfuromusa sp.]
MAIRRHPTKGPGWWQIHISNGRKKKQDTYTYEGSEAEALAFESELRGIPTEASDQRLLDVIGRFLDWYHVNRAARSVKDCEATLPRIIARIGNKHLSLLRQADYNLYKQKRQDDGVSKRTVNIELTYLRALLRFAEDELKIPVGEYPKLYTKKQTAPPAKTPLTPYETAQLLEQLHGDKKTIAMPYSWCGLRRNEALTLKRENIDLSSGLIHIVAGKGGKNRVVPIVGDELKQRLASDCKGKKNTDYLFINKQTGKPYLNIKKSLKAAATRAGITKPIWNHLLRHSGATAALQAGMDLRTLQEFLGHSDIRMTEIYTHMSADMLKTEAEKIDALHKAIKQKMSEMPERTKRNKAKVI